MILIGVGLLFICMIKPAGFCSHLACSLDNHLYVCTVSVFANKRAGALFLHCFLVKLVPRWPHNTHISMVFNWSLRLCKPGSCNDQQIFACIIVVQIA